MESRNPFEQPRVESPVIRDDSRRTLFIFSLVIIVLEAFCRRSVEFALFQKFAAEGYDDIYSTGVWRTPFVVLGPMCGALLSVYGSARRALLIAPLLAAAYAISMRLDLPILPPLYSMVRGLIWVPLAVTVGRRVLSEPELRDAWFVAALCANTLGSFVASISGFFNFEPFLIATGGLAAIAAIVFIFFRPAPAQDEKIPSKSPVWIVLAGIALFQLNRFSQRTPHELSSLIPLLGGVALAVLYMARNANHREDRAWIKLAIGAALTILSIGVAKSGIYEELEALTLVGAAATLFIGPIAFGVAAAQFSEKKAYLWAAIFSIATGLF